MLVNISLMIRNTGVKQKFRKTGVVKIQEFLGKQILKIHHLKDPGNSGCERRW